MNKKHEFIYYGNLLCECRYFVKVFYQNDYVSVAGECAYFLTIRYIPKEELGKGNIKYKTVKRNLCIDFRGMHKKYALPAISNVIGAFSVLSQKQSLNESESYLVDEIKRLMFNKKIRNIELSDLEKLSFIACKLVSKQELEKQNEIGKKYFEKYINSKTQTCKNKSSREQ